MKKYRILFIIFITLSILIFGFFVLYPFGKDVHAFFRSKNLKNNSTYFKSFLISLSKLNFKIKGYPIHKKITTTVFWAGEGEDTSNGFISNKDSAWDGSWEENYGGYDDPNHRNGYFPAVFRPKENPFYFALPFNDFTDAGKRKSNLENIIYWAKSKIWDSNESMCKNRWIKISYHGRVVYAQWEDAGPYNYNDSNYVFGKAKPMSKDSGLDVSPAVRDYLGLNGKNLVNWQFIDENSVPEGPWKEIITNSQISY
jgi:hypothetical protein